MAKNFASAFEARWSKHIEICEFHRNKEGGAKDQQDGVIYFFHGPYIIIIFSNKTTADIKKIEEKYKAELEKSATALTDQKTSFDTRLKASALKAALAEVAASAGLATNPHLVEAFQHELGKGASLGDDGTITYQDDNGVPQFYEGKPLTVATRIEQMKQVETNDVFFGSTTSQGTGNTGGGGGNAPAGVSRKSLLADNAAMSDYFKDHSSKDFEALPSE